MTLPEPSSTPYLFNENNLFSLLTNYMFVLHNYA
jgi:hypothetical protein